jgi:putative DNA primase/helicase
MTSVEVARAAPIENELMGRGVPLRRQGRELIGPCPRCGGDDRFSVNPVKQVWHCRQCKPANISGDVIGLVQWLDGCDFGKAIETLTGNRPSPTQTPARSAQTPDAYEQEQHRKAAWLWSQRRPVTGTIAEKYLRDRRGYRGPLPTTLVHRFHETDHMWRIHNFRRGF